MTRLLHSLTLLAFILISNLGNSQSKTNTIDFTNLSVNTDVFDIESTLISNLNKKKVFSYSLMHKEHEHHFLHTDLDHDHKEGVVLIDIISSDEGADVNCSGGFCMVQGHFHKKGLSIKRQLFGYFMSISC